MEWRVYRESETYLAFNSKYKKLGYVYGKYASDFNIWRMGKGSVFPAINERLIEDAANTTDPREVYSLARIYLRSRKLLNDTKHEFGLGFIPLSDNSDNNVIY
jgi:hypothetical protein